MKKQKLSINGAYGYNGYYKKSLDNVNSGGVQPQMVLFLLHGRLV